MATDLETVFNSYAAIDNIQATDTDWTRDLHLLREGVLDVEDILGRCLEASTPEQEDGWIDYVLELAKLARVRDPQDEAACRADWQHDCERDDRATGDLLW